MSDTDALVSWFLRGGQTPPTAPPPAVVIVDDEICLARSLGRVLSRRGHQVLVASDGNHGLSIIESQEDDSSLVLLADIQMPGTSGFELTRAARKHSPTLPVVLITADPHSDVLRRALEVGAYSCLLKPIPLSTLFGSLDEAAGTRAQRLALLMGAEPRELLWHVRSFLPALRPGCAKLLEELCLASLLPSPAIAHLRLVSAACRAMTMIQRKSSQPVTLRSSVEVGLDNTELGDHELCVVSLLAGAAVRSKADLVTLRVLDAECRVATVYSGHSGRTACATTRSGAMAAFEDSGECSVCLTTPLWPLLSEIASVWQNARRGPLEW